RSAWIPAGSRPWSLIVHGSCVRFPARRHLRASEAPSDAPEPHSVPRTCLPVAGDQWAAQAYDSGDLGMVRGMRSSSLPASPATSARWIAPVLIPVVVALVAGGTLAPKPDGTPFTAVVGAIL